MRSLARNHTTLVVATRDRRAQLLESLERIHELPERPPVIVVDNASRDGSPEAVEARFPEARIIRSGTNLGAAARNVGVRLATTPFVAFSDDDSWWAPGALGRAAHLFDRHPRMGLVQARILVGPDDRVDPTCVKMSRSPLPPDDSLPGPPLLGFIACGAIVRRDAFLEAGGFEPRFGMGAEERLLALDLASAGWGLAYVDGIVAHHHPSSARDPRRRKRSVARNRMWILWMRRSPASALRGTAALLEGRDRDAWAGLTRAVLGGGWALRSRRVVPPAVERASRLLE